MCRRPTASSPSRRPSSGGTSERPHYPRQSAEFLVYGIDHIPDDPGGDRANWYTNADENYEVRTFPDLTSGVGWAETMGAVVYVAHPYWTQLPLDDLLEQRGFAGHRGLQRRLRRWRPDAVTPRSGGTRCWRGDAGRSASAPTTSTTRSSTSAPGGRWCAPPSAPRKRCSTALRDGMAYFSHGPEIRHVEVVDGAVEVECSPARSVLLQGEEELGLRGDRADAAACRQGQVLADRRPRV